MTTTTPELDCGDALWTALEAHDWTQGDTTTVQVTADGGRVTRATGTWQHQGTGRTLLLAATSPYTLAHAELRYAHGEAERLTSPSAVWEAVTGRYVDTLGQALYLPSFDLGDEVAYRYAGPDVKEVVLRVQNRRWSRETGWSYYCLPVDGCGPGYHLGELVITKHRPDPIAG